MTTPEFLFHLFAISTYLHEIERKWRKSCSEPVNCKSPWQGVNILLDR